MSETRTTENENLKPKMTFGYKMEAVIILDDSETTEICGDVITAAMRNMFTALKEDTTIDKENTVLTIITFSDHTTLALDGKPIAQLTENDLPKLYHLGATDPGEAIRFALEKATDRYDSWKGFRRIHPIFYFCTDGKPDYGKVGKETEVDPVKQKEIENKYNEQKKIVIDLQEKNKLTFVTLGFGPEADYEDLKTITKHNNEIRDCTDAKKMNYFFTEVIVSTTSQRAQKLELKIDPISAVFGNN